MLRYITTFITMIGVFATNAYAIPAFSRQVGVSCSACHSQNGYPTLSRFGRDFKASGYTLMGTEETVGGSTSVSDKLVSIPSALNISVIAGSTVDGTVGQGNSGQTVATNNFGIFLGGRVSENVGAFVEVGYDEGSDATTQHFAVANLVIPLTKKIGDNTYGVVPYSTDGHTATASEFYDNGGNAAISRIGARDTYGAKGLSFYVYNPNYFVNYTAWSNGNNSASDVKIAHYLRLAYTPQFGNWDLEIGVQYMTGNTNKTDGDGYVIANAIEQKTDAYSIDFNALSTISGYPIDLAMSYANAQYDANSLFTTNTDAQAGQAFVCDAKLGVIPRVLVAHVKYAYDDHVLDTNDQINTETLGLRYFLAENVNFEANYNFISNNNTASDDTYDFTFEVAF